MSVTIQPVAIIENKFEVSLPVYDGRHIWNMGKWIHNARLCATANVSFGRCDLRQAYHEYFIITPTAIKSRYLYIDLGMRFSKMHKGS